MLVELPTIFFEISLTLCRSHLQHERQGQKEAEKICGAVGKTA